MSCITVRVGREEKEISGLTRRTTCSDVLQALLKDRKVERGDGDTRGDEFEVNENTPLKELAQNYVVVESWRGCEKALPPRTRILAVWQAWGKEQCHVKFSLKKNKHTRYRETKEQDNQYNSMIEKMSAQHPEAMAFLHKLSHGQKRRIRRNIMQYQRAVLIQHTKETTVETSESLRRLDIGEPGSDSAGKEASRSRKQVDNERVTTVTLSEEQFVDGVVTGPDCILHHSGKSKFIQSALDNKDFNREYTNYRRRNPHRRRSFMLDDSDGHSDQNDVLSPSGLKHNVSHYPYCQNSRRRSKSSSRRRRRSRNRRHGRVSKSRRQGRPSYRASTDETTSTGTTSTGASDVECEDSHSAGEDADDEKSIKAEYGSIRQKIIPYPKMLPACSDSCSSGTTTASNATTATDSSSGTTTCSESSNTSGSSLSGTSSSEMSSSADYCEAFLAKRLAPAVPPPLPAKAVVQEKTKTSGNSGAAKLFRKVAGPNFKPAHSIIGSFRKKKRSPTPAQEVIAPKASSMTSSKAAATGKRTVTFAASPPTHKGRSKESSVPAAKEVKNSRSASPKPVQTTNKSSANGVCHLEAKRPAVDVNANEQKQNDSEAETKSLEKWKQIILSQDRLLKEKENKIASTNVEIQKIETEVHRCRSQAHGKNYVQDTYLSGCGLPPSEEDGKMRLTSKARKPAQWIAESQDSASLEEYVDACQKVVEMQIKIEENKRQFEILLQEMQDEVWRASSAEESSQNPFTAAASALGLVQHKNEDSSDDESSTRHESLSVSSGKKRKDSSSEREKLAAAEATLEVEKSNNELEANLYLSLRLSSELQDVEQKLETSHNVLQAKGETLLAMVRGLAESPEGISPELWEEYGELLSAYDDEVTLQRYLNAQAEASEETDPKPSGDQPSRADTPDVLLNEEEDPSSPTKSALHHALSPWLWCEHCKLELEHQQMGHPFNGLTPPASPHWLSHANVPLNLSELPLPIPSPVKAPPQASRSLAPLLPMPPIPDNDSDYDDLPSIKLGDATSTIISTENAIPRGMVLRHSGRHQNNKSDSTKITTPFKDYLAVNRNSCANNTDDSGNASATSSQASTNSDGGSIDMGSRNSSCDGGSPRPSPCLGAESQDSGSSSPFFVRGNVKRGSRRSRFPFPPKSDDASKSPMRLAQQRSSSQPDKPIIPPKPNSMKSHIDVKRLQSQGCNEADRLAEQGKLLRRNSGKLKRNPLLIEDKQFTRRATSFGKGGIGNGALPNRLNGIVGQPIVRNSHCDLRPNKGATKPKVSSKPNQPKLLKPGRYIPSPVDLLSTKSVVASAPCSPFYTDQKAFPRRVLVPGDVKRRIHSDNYDNDSDTGLSSLHSADSDLAMYSETLV